MISMITIKNKLFLALGVLLLTGCYGQLQQCSRNRVPINRQNKPLQSNYRPLPNQTPFLSNPSSVQELNDGRKCRENLRQRQTQQGTVIPFPERTARREFPNEMIMNQYDLFELQQPRYQEQEWFFEDPSFDQNGLQFQKTRQNKMQNERSFNQISQEQMQNERSFNQIPPEQIQNERSFNRILQEQMQNKRSFNIMPQEQMQNERSFNQILQNKKIKQTKNEKTQRQKQFSENTRNGVSENETPFLEKNRSPIVQRNEAEQSRSNQIKPKNRNMGQSTSQYQSLPPQGLQQLSLLHQQYQILSNQLKQIKNLIKEIPNRIKNLQIFQPQQQVSQQSPQQKQYQLLSNQLQQINNLIQDIPNLIENLLNDTGKKKLSNETQNATDVSNAVANTINIASNSILNPATAMIQENPDHLEVLMDKTIENKAPFTVSYLPDPINSDLTNGQNIIDPFASFGNNIRENETLVAVQNAPNVSNSATNNTSSFSSNIINSDAATVVDKSNRLSQLTTGTTKNESYVALQDTTSISNSALENTPILFTNSVFNLSTINPELLKNDFADKMESFKNHTSLSEEEKQSELNAQQGIKTLQVQTIKPLISSSQKRLLEQQQSVPFQPLFNFQDKMLQPLFEIQSQSSAQDESQLQPFKNQEQSQMVLQF